MRIRRNALTDRYVVPILAFGDQVVWDSVVTLAIRNAETASFAAKTSVWRDGVVRGKAVRKTLIVVQVKNAV